MVDDLNLFLQTEDDLSLFFSVGRRAQFFSNENRAQYSCEGKTTSNIFQIEDDPHFWFTEDDLIFSIKRSNNSIQPLPPKNKTNKK